jgi:hypothetical protein
MDKKSIFKPSNTTRGGISPQTITITCSMLALQVSMITVYMVITLDSKSIRKLQGHLWEAKK